MHTGFTRRQWLILIGVSLGSFLTFLDLTIVNIALPAIITDLHTNLTQATWVLNAYSITVAALLLSTGRLADHYGQKVVFIGGLVIFIVASLGCGLAPSIYWLIAFRVLQGVGASALMPVSLSILFGEFAHARTMVVGIYGGLSAAAAALGPTLGGVLTQYASWNWIFFINLPIGLAALVLCLKYVPERRAVGEAQKFDVLGTLLVSGGLFLLVFGLVQGNDWGWSSGRIVASFIGAAVLFGAFVPWELHNPMPLLDLRLFRMRPFAAASAGLVCCGFALMGAQLILVLFMTSVLGYSELRAALCITPMPAVTMLLMPLSSRLMDRIGPRVLSIIGFIVLAAGLASLATLGAESSSMAIIVRCVVLGVGLAFTMPPLLVAGMFQLPPEVAGVGSGALNTARQVGFAIGVAVLVSILTSTSAARLMGAKQDATGYVRAHAALTADGKTQLLTAIAAVPTKSTGGEAGAQPAATSAAADAPAAVVGLSRLGGDLALFATQSTRLASGVVRIQSGAGELAAKTQQATQGGRRLTKGLGRLSAGSSKLSAGAGKASSGASALASSLGAATPDASRLASGSDALASGADRLTGSLGRLQSGSARLRSSARQLSAGSTRLAGATTALSGGLGQLASSAGQVKGGAAATVNALDAYAQANPDALKDAAFQRALATAQAVSGGASQLASGASEAHAKSGTIAGGAHSLARGASALAGGASQLDGGLRLASGGARRLAAGSDRVASGTARLSSGLRSAASGASALSQATTQIAGGAARLDAGSASAASGARRLTAGVARVGSGAQRLHSGLKPAAAATQQMESAFAGAQLLSAARHVESVLRDAAAASFTWPFLVSAAVALLAVPMCLPLGSRIAVAGAGVEGEPLAVHF